jgi:glucose-1-phosphate thymidylyltransferase
MQRELARGDSVKSCMKGVVVISDPGSGTNSARSGRLDALEHVANRPIADHVLEALKTAGADEVIVASSAERASEVRECLEASEVAHGATLRYVARGTRIDIDGALQMAAPLVDGSPCIVHHGSGLLGESLEPLLRRVQGAWPDVILMMHPGDRRARHLRLAPMDAISATPSQVDHADLGVAGVCLFGSDGLARASAAAWRDGEDSDLRDVADRLVEQGGSWDTLHVNGWREYGGDPLDLLELNRLALDGLENDPIHPGSHGNRIEGRVRIHERAMVRSSVIVGPTVIGPGAHVSEAYIGPYTSIGASSVIEGVEIERSIVDAGARITHVGCRLVSSVIGRDARVYRDFSLPRALRLRVGDGTEVALC